MSINRIQFLESVERTEILPSAYAEDVLVRLAHNSTAIEGNTLTLSDTVTLLVDQITPAAGIQLREVYEVENHRGAIAYLLEAIADEKPLTTGLARDIHYQLMDHLVFDRGAFKTSSNIILGASWEPAPPSRVPNLMMEWADQTEWQTANLDDQALLEAIAASHIRFEKIHPFSDGNGRTGRALIAYQTIRRFGFPAIISVSDKSKYIKILDAEDAPSLAAMMAESLAFEADRLDSLSAT